MGPGVLTLEPAEFTRLALALAGVLGAAAGVPAVVVTGGTESAPWTPGSIPVLVVGVREAGWTGRPTADDPHDIVLAADDPRLDAVLDQVEGHPVTATALAVLLRSHPTDDVDAGLADESATYSTLQAGSEFHSWLASRSDRGPAVDHEPIVLVERDDRTLRVTLNRPDSHNAVNEPLRAGLADALALAVIDPTVEQVVLRGNGPSYCSGGDLREFGAFTDPASAHLSRLTRSPGRLAHRLGDRLHVELYGPCLGAGIEVPAFAGTAASADSTTLPLTLPLDYRRTERHPTTPAGRSGTVCPPQAIRHDSGRHWPD